MDKSEQDRRTQDLKHQARLEDARQIGLTTLKTLATLNSGAFVVLLTFIGNAATQSRFTMPLYSLKCGLYLFLGGIVAVLAALLVSYIATANVRHPSETTDQTLHGRRVWWGLTMGVFFAIISTLAFSAGVAVVVNGVQNV